MSEDTDSWIKPIKDWFLKHPCYGVSVASFCSGIFITIFFGNQILVSDIFPFAQNLIVRLNHLPSDMSGSYYYVTTPQNTQDISVNCGDKLPAKAIGGFVRIQHKRTIVNPSISFLNGERKYCVSFKGEVLPLLPPINWSSRWVFINDGMLHAYLEIGDDKESLLEANVLSILEDKFFNANMLYISQENKKIGATNIKFSKCNNSEECDKELNNTLSKLVQKKAE